MSKNRGCSRPDIWIPLGIAAALCWLLAGPARAADVDFGVGVYADERGEGLVGQLEVANTRRGWLSTRVYADSRLSESSGVNQLATTVRLGAGFNFGRSWHILAGGQVSAFLLDRPVLPGGLVPGGAGISPYGSCEYRSGSTVFAARRVFADDTFAELERWQGEARLRWIWIQAEHAEAAVPGIGGWSGSVAIRWRP